MSLTTEQKADIAFKKLMADKSDSSENTAYFEELVNTRKAILLNDVWTQSDQIPATAAVVAGITEQVTDLSLTHIPGANSFAFEDGTLKDVIPFTFGDGSYLYTLKTDGDVDIPFGQNDWFLDPESGVLTFFGGFPAGVDAVTPPKISCYKYIGSKGNFQAAVTAPTVETFTPTNGQTLFVLGATPGSFKELKVNGVEAEIGVHFTLVGPNLTWLNLDYQLDTDDRLVVEYFL